MSVATKFGSAYVDSQGYLRVSSMKEGNHNKLVHRLMFEDFYQIKLPKHIHIHHEDGNKLNNEIWNLVPLTNSEHSFLHHKGAIFTEERCKNISDAKKGHKHSEEAKQKMKIAKLGKSQPKQMMVNRSKSRNKIGLFRVYKSQNKSCKQGWDYCYNYVENKKRKELHSVDIFKLRKKVIEKGLPWIIVDEEKVKRAFDEKTADRIIHTIQSETYD